MINSGEFYFHFLGNLFPKSFHFGTFSHNDGLSLNLFFVKLE